MNKSITLNAIKKYRDEYTKAVRTINQIKSFDDLTDEAKERRINDVITEYDKISDALRDSAVAAVKDLQNEIHEKHRVDIAEGLSMAAEINLIKGNIQDGSFNKNMLAYCREVFADNPLAIDSIRGALMASKDESLAALAVGLPIDQAEANIASLDKVIGNIQNVSPINAADNDINVAMWQSGSSFDSICTFIENME